MKPNPYLLVDKDRYGWSEIEVAQFERARRHGTVDTFERCRLYWSVMNYLSRRPYAAERPFLTLSEAVKHYGWQLKIARMDPPGFIPGPGYDLAGLRERYVVARYFSRKGPEAWQ